MFKKTKVLIVDDSALIRQILTKILSSVNDIEVVGTAADPYIAREKIKRLNPDVLTLDIELPRMDGLAFLSNLMRLRPMPVVMISVFTQKNAEITLQALEYGAVDFISKPQIDIVQTLESYSEEIISKIRTAAHPKVQPPLIKPKPIKIIPKNRADIIIKKNEYAHHRHVKTEKIIAIGA
ncbi:response regulator, partial [Candidatus Marithioploca araucensis]|nr:response regulator [Candidatus Marithioploca araucensis]